MLNRRDWLRGMSAAAVLPFADGWLTAELADWGREVHAAAQSTAIGNSELMSGLSVVCERIIPTDETPGAIAAGVPRFIDHMLAAWYDPPERQRVLTGLQDIDQESRSRFGRSFIEASAEQQDTLLIELDALGAKSWFGTIKYLTIWGYYTSEIGVTQELQQIASPGRYDGFAPYTPRTRSRLQERAVALYPQRHHAAE